MAGRISAQSRHEAPSPARHEQREQEDAVVRRFERRFDKLLSQATELTRAQVVAAALSEPKKPTLLGKLSMRPPKPVPDDAGYLAIIERAACGDLYARITACLPHVSDAAAR